MSCRDSFFLPVRVLGRVFRGKFLSYLGKAFRKGKLQFHGEMAGLAKPAAFDELRRGGARTEWVVYAKPPFGGPEQVLKYLARYTHRVAISNRRLLSMEDGRTTFEWKDYAGGNKTLTMTLETTEFIRRFLLHIAPVGFMRVRQFGFLANRVRRERLAQCRKLVGAVAPSRLEGESKKERGLCPVCRTGHMVIVERLAPAAPPPAYKDSP